MKVSKLAFCTVAGTLVLAGALLSPARGQAPLKVGLAEVIRNEVVSVNGAELIQVSVGDEVIRDETLQTSDDSDARIRLLDDTKLSLGPRSTIKIDRAVYSGETSYKEVTIKLTEGAFRFITGKSDKKSYRIETPFASIGVRGTILDIRIGADQTLVALQDGEASVCAGRQCTQLLTRGQTANVTREAGGIRIRREPTPSWTFASVCSGNASLCSPLPPLRKAGIAPTTLPAPAGAKSKITRFCADGQPMLGGSCDTSRAAATDFLPRGDLPRNSLSSAPLDFPRSSSTASDLPGVGSPSSMPGLTPGVTPSAPRVQLPGLRR